MKFRLVEKLNHDTFLYHGTFNIKDILESNSLKVGKQYVDGSAVCLSRDFQFVKNFPFILVLNRDLLKHHYKLIPKSDSKNMRNKFSRNISTQSKAEDVILKDIINLKNYIEYIVTDFDLDYPGVVSKEYFIKEIL